MLEKEKEKRWKNARTAKRKKTHTQKNSVLEGLWTLFFAQIAFLEQLANTICVREVKNAHFRWHYLFWENGTFLCVTIQIHQTQRK